MHRSINKFVVSPESAFTSNLPYFLKISIAALKELFECIIRLLLGVVDPVNVIQLLHSFGSIEEGSYISQFTSFYKVFWVEISQIKMIYLAK